jgi:transposase-like protein
MKTSKLDPSHIKQEIAKRSATGESQGSIAKEFGMCHTTIRRFARKEDVQRLIKEETRNLLEVVPDAVENIKTLVREMKNIPKNDHKRPELAYKASQKVLESAGIMNTPTPSQTVVSIINKDNPSLAPVIEALIKKHFEGYILDKPSYEIKDDKDE